MRNDILATVIASLVAAPAMALAAGNNILSALHILDRQTGKPAPGIGGGTGAKKDNGWTQLNTRHTDPGWTY